MQLGLGVVPGERSFFHGNNRNGTNVWEKKVGIHAQVIKWNVYINKLSCFIFIRLLEIIKSNGRLPISQFTRSHCILQVLTAILPISQFTRSHCILQVVSAILPNPQFTRSHCILQVVSAILPIPQFTRSHCILQVVSAILPNPQFTRSHCILQVVSAILPVLIFE